MEGQIEEPLGWDFTPESACFLGQAPRIRHESATNPMIVPMPLRVARSISLDDLKHPTEPSWSEPPPGYHNILSPNPARLATLLPAERLGAEPRFGFPTSQMDVARNHLSSSRWWQSRP